MSGSAARPIVVGLIALALLLLGLIELPRKQRDATFWLDHTFEVLEQVATLEASLATSSNAAQSFLLERTNEDRLRFEQAATLVPRDLAVLRALTADNGVQQATLDALAPLIDSRFAMLRAAMNRAAGDAANALPSNGDRELTAGIAAKLVAMKAEERRLLTSRTVAARDAAWQMTGGLLACGLAAVACAVLAATLLLGRRARDVAHLKQLHQLNAGLEQKVQVRTAELNANRVRLRAYVDHLADGLLAIRRERDGRFVYEEVNAAARAMLGLVEDVAGREVREVWPEAQATTNEDHLNRCAAERVPHRYSATFATRHGPRELRVVIAPVPDAAESAHPEGRIGLLLVSVRDVTREVAVEAQLRQAQRMEAVGQLTAGVAHDFNNHLQTILGSLELLHERPRQDAEETQYIALADKAARRGALLTHRLLAFSRKQPLTPVLVKPERTLAELAELLGPTLGGSVRVETRLEAAPWPVHADDAQLENCLVNLALNARDAMPSGGLLVLGLANVASRAAEAAGLPPGDYVRFSVADEGTGMSPDTQLRAFEPFFTTKELGKGTGLGLSMVQGFARQSGGDVRIDSVPGAGTTVSLWLPRGAEAANPVAPALPPRSGHDGPDRCRGRVMVVDDDPAVAQTLLLFLRKGGFSPFAVDSAEAALTVLRAGDPCDLLVTDQSMPVMTGCELIEAVARLRPALPAMLVTGFDIVSGLNEKHSRVTVLRKPFDRRAFLNQVEDLIEPARATA